MIAYGPYIKLKSFLLMNKDTRVYECCQFVQVVYVNKATEALEISAPERYEDFKAALKFLDTLHSIKFLVQNYLEVTRSQSASRRNLSTSSSPVVPVEVLDQCLESGEASYDQVLEDLKACTKHVQKKRDLKLAEKKDAQYKPK